MRTATLAGGPGTLTARELDVVRLIVAGKTNREIAAQLIISHRTVEIHRGRIMRKSGVRSVSELVKLYMAAKA